MDVVRTGQWAFVAVDGPMRAATQPPSIGPPCPALGHQFGRQLPSHDGQPFWGKEGIFKFEAF
jgi:hypothetical protein